MRDPTRVVDGAHVFQLAFVVEVATEPRHEPLERSAIPDHLGGGVAEPLRDVLLHRFRKARRIGEFDDPCEQRIAGVRIEPSFAG